MRAFKKLIEEQSLNVWRAIWTTTTIGLAWLELVRTSQHFLRACDASVRQHEMLVLKEA